MVPQLSLARLSPLEQQTQTLMFQGIAKTTRKPYDSALRKFLEFCHWSQCLNANGSLCQRPSHDSFDRVTTHLFTNKVYLASVRSLHIQSGFANPLSNCLRLERVIRGIKRSQGISTREWLPVALTVVSRVQAVLNFDCYDDDLFWAACCTGFFGFLRLSSIW